MCSSRAAKQIEGRPSNCHACGRAATDRSRGAAKDGVKRSRRRVLSYLVDANCLNDAPAAKKFPRFFVAALVAARRDRMLDFVWKIPSDPSLRPALFANRRHRAEVLNSAASKPFGELLGID
jgi:hypothetical protein